MFPIGLLVIIQVVFKQYPFFRSGIDSSDSESLNHEDNMYGQSENYFAFFIFVNFDYDPLNDFEIDENNENGFNDLTEAYQSILFKSLKVDDKFFLVGY